MLLINSLSAVMIYRGGVFSWCVDLAVRTKPACRIWITAQPECVMNACRRYLSFAHISIPDTLILFLNIGPTSTVSWETFHESAEFSTKNADRVANLPP